jgi:hypothetical protein
MTPRRPFPPFSLDSAVQKVRSVENAWNGRSPASVALAYTPDSRWRDRVGSFTGRDAIEAFLTRKWQREHDYRLIGELWAFSNDRIAMRSVSESRDPDGRFWRSFGNEIWQFAADGLLAERQASINDIEITARERLFLWPLGTRPIDHPGLTELEL